MKRYLSLFVAVICSSLAYAQEPVTSNSEPVKQWTSSFNALDVDASIKLTLTPMGEDQAPYIIYDTKGVESSKFTMEVDRDGVLKIRERYDPKRVGVTEVKLYCNSLIDIRLSRADTHVDGVLTGKIMDIDVSNGAQLVAEVDVKDIKIRISGDSRVEISGSTLYHDADVATAKYNALELESVSTIVRAEHNAEVKVDAIGRLEAKSSTGGKIFYKSEPELLRTEKSLFGVDVQQLK
ncbi:MAG: DUF2807 domain-containing protein [Alistipes sp.]|nr:DUF2807 domain-containing protein [Alistipes sp.]